LISCLICNSLFSLSKQLFKIAVSDKQTICKMVNIEINSQIRNRWSPRHYSQQSISEPDILKLFEAARWAPSSRNSQPWRFIFARREDQTIWPKLFDCLADLNKVWVEKAPVLVLALVQKTDVKTGSNQRHSWYDLGLAMGNLTYQANSMGIFVRNMGGFDPLKAIANFNIPEMFEPVVMMTLGIPGEIENEKPEFSVPTGPNRTRRDLSQLIFNGNWDLMI
jgi:nitroreductase